MISENKRPLRQLVVLGSLLILVCFAKRATAQGDSYVEGVSEITSDTTSETVYTYSATFETYDLWPDYSPYVHAKLKENDSIVGDDKSGDVYPAVDNSTGDYGYAAFVFFQHPVTLGDSYTQSGDHYINAQYWEIVGGQTYWENPNYFFGLMPGGPSDPSGTDYPSDGGGDYLLVNYSIYLGSTAAQITAGAPSITDITPDSGTIGVPGTISVNGQYLIDPWTATATPAITGAGVSLSVSTSPQPTDSDLTLNYSIAEGASTGPQSLTLATRFGTSNAVTFTVGYPGAHITSLDPPTWQAGENFTLTINGTGFGNLPTVNISGAAGVQYGQTMNTNPQGTQTQVPVTIQPDAPNGTATVTVIPGYAGSTYYCGDCNGGSPNGTDFATVLAAQNSCPAQLDAHSGFAGIVPTGTAGGSGTMIASFSGGAFDGNSVTVPYGPYSTPESIASHIAALITKRYYNSGLSAQAIGSQILYKSTAVLGAPTISASGQSFTKDTSTACPKANMKYVLAVLSDTVKWIDEGLNHGRQVVYSLEDWPKTMGSLGQATPFPNAIVTEHLTNSMSYGTGSNGVISGQFTDILGNISGMNAGIYRTDRYFTVNSSGDDLGQIMSYDAAGIHCADRIEIHLPTGPSILNNWKERNGSPKNISIP